MEKAIENGKRIFADATKLEYEKSPTGTFLYAIAIEELSKAYNLGKTAIHLLEGDSVDWDLFWKNFRNHKLKQADLFRMILVGLNLLKKNFHRIQIKNPKLVSHYKDSNDVSMAIEELTEEIRAIESGKLEKLKWQFLYIDYVDDNWKLPDNNINVGIFVSQNIKTYLVDLETMKSHIEKAIQEKMA